jgi:hypothetical protein
MRILQQLGLYVVDRSTPAQLIAADVLMTGLVLSAGTEGFNSIMKFMGYAKENAKGGDGSTEAGGVAADNQSRKLAAVD